MAHLIDSVGDLTDLHDKDDLEITLATVMFELVDASALYLWRVVRCQGQIRLRTRVKLPMAIDNAPLYRDDFELNQSKITNGIDFKSLERDKQISLRNPREHDRAEKLAPAFSHLETAPADPADLPLLESRPDLRACYDANLSMQCTCDEPGMLRHVFPISDGREVICLLEIMRPLPLRSEEEVLVFGLLRIYRNHLGILDYSDRDELTRLLNRRTFDELFKRASGQEAGHPQPRFAPERRSSTGRPSHAHLAIIDIDFFKRVNDQFGHPYGDEVLVLIARLMEQSFRDTDRLFRFGGEEFLVILPGTDLQDAELALERFRASVEVFSFPQVGCITVSLGMTMIQAGDTGLDAFGRADEALYAAKQMGRNQLRCYELLIAEGVLTSRRESYQDIEMF